MLTVKDFKKDTFVILGSQIVVSKHPYVTIGSINLTTLTEGTVLRILENPKSYKGSGRAVKFKVEGTDDIYYELYSDFKRAVILRDTCSHCKKEIGYLMINPFDEDVHGKTNFEFVCHNCYENIIDEI